MEKIILDRFPCHLVAVPSDFTDDVTTLSSFDPTPNATYQDVTRIVVTDKKIVIAKDGLTGPQIIFKEDYEQLIVSKESDQDSFVVTASGKMLAFKKDRGCGCGSRLKGWNPYKTVLSMED